MNEWDRPENPEDYYFCKGCQEFRHKSSFRSYNSSHCRECQEKEDIKSRHNMYVREIVRERAENTKNRWK